MPVAMEGGGEGEGDGEANDLLSTFILAVPPFAATVPPSLPSSLRPSTARGNKKGAAAVAAESRFVTRRRFFVSPSIFAFSPPAALAGEFFVPQASAMKFGMHADSVPLCLRIFLLLLYIYLSVHLSRLLSSKFLPTPQSFSAFRGRGYLPLPEEGGKVGGKV